MADFAPMRASAEYAELLALSAALGSDPLQVQGPGGNSSLKRHGKMLIKASGTWLAHALTKDIMVPVRLDGLAQAVRRKAPGVETADGFVAVDENPSGLRPSIETTVHTSLDWPVVLHTHCVNTIAVAARADAASIVADRLGDMDACFIPYVKPGLRLALAILEHAGPSTKILVLGNHGLVAVGATVAEAEARLREVSARFAGPVRPALPATDRLPALLRDSEFEPVRTDLTHAIARDPFRLQLARAGCYYPDHAVFLGADPAVAEPGESAGEAAARFAAQSGDMPALILFPGEGTAIRKGVTAAAHALAEGYGNVLARLPEDAPLVTVPRAALGELLDWDAEKYRQQMALA